MGQNFNALPAKLVVGTLVVIKYAAIIKIVVMWRVVREVVVDVLMRVLVRSAIGAKWYLNVIISKVVVREFVIILMTAKVVLME